MYQPIHHTPERVSAAGSGDPVGHRRPRRDGAWLPRIAALLALLWLFLRSGSKPTRLSYPCQQSALGLALGAFAAPLAAAGLAARTCPRHSSRRGFAVIGTLLLLAGTLTVLSISVVPGALDDPTVNLLVPPADHHPDVFLVNSARSVDGDRFGGVDDLVTLMGAAGRPFYRSSIATDVSGPDGVVAADSVVLVKVNAQWAERGGTNTDVLSGVLRRIVEHPDGFLGEIVVADNGQGYGSLTRSLNNAVDQGQSVQAVVDRFRQENWIVSTFRWDDLRYSSVAEYADGDTRSGYVVDAAPDPQTGVRVSYPKFRTTWGTPISYKLGIWSSTLSVYDPGRLVVLNMPVLKTHSIYGVTAAVKNHMGVVTQAQSTDSHAGVGRGGLGSVLSRVRRPDLTILDAIWVLAIPGAGPSASYAQSTACDKLLASTDPVAVDAWAVKFVLLPEIIAGGFIPPEYAAQDPDNPDGSFRRYLDRTLDQLLSAGISATNDYRAVRLHAWSNDHDLDGDLDLADFADWRTCLSGPGDPVPRACEGSDFTLDGASDLRDFAQLATGFTGPR